MVAFRPKMIPQGILSTKCLAMKSQQAADGSLGSCFPTTQKALLELQRQCWLRSWFVCCQGSHEIAFKWLSAHCSLLRFSSLCALSCHLSRCISNSPLKNQGAISYLWMVTQYSEQFEHSCGSTSCSSSQPESWI